MQVTIGPRPELFDDFSLFGMYCAFVVREVHCYHSDACNYGYEIQTVSCHQIHPNTVSTVSTSGVTTLVG